MIYGQIAATGTVLYLVACVIGGLTATTYFGQFLAQTVFTIGCGLIVAGVLGWIWSW